jgi:hypothetical protein
MEIQPLGRLGSLLILHLPPGPSHGQCCLGVHVAAKGSLVRAEMGILGRVVGPRQVCGSRAHEPAGLPF